MLSRQDGHWQLSNVFDISAYISPEWDESWNANIYSKLRWKNIRKTIAGYCPMLNSTWVEQQRTQYAELDKQTPTDEFIKNLVAEGELPDPGFFDITSVCEGLP